MTTIPRHISPPAEPKIINVSGDDNDARDFLFDMPDKAPDPQKRHGLLRRLIDKLKDIFAFILMATDDQDQFEDSNIHEEMDRP